jgi:GTP-binding protein YchF
MACWSANGRIHRFRCQGDGHFCAVQIDAFIIVGGDFFDDLLTMQIALIGLPWTGKTTLFRTLAAYAGAAAPESAGAVARCVVRVPDPRLDRLSAMYPRGRRVPATIEYLDVPGLDVKRERGHGVPGAILAQIKNARALLEVIGGFAPEDQAELGERVRRFRASAESMATEMLVGDLELVENRRERLKKQMKKGKRPEDEREDELLARCEAVLGEGQPLRTLELSADERLRLGGFQLLTLKPVLRVINVSEDLLGDRDRIGELWAESEAGESEGPPIVLAAKIEEEIAALPEEERAAFLADLGLEAPALERLMRASYRLLGLISFFTVGDDEVRAWTVPAGIRAQPAAGEIHSDLERGFIRAEVVSFDDLIAGGSLDACRKGATLRIEGKDYVIADGDVVSVRFSV